MPVTGTEQERQVGVDVADTEVGVDMMDTEIGVDVAGGHRDRDRQTDTHGHTRRCFPSSPSRTGLRFPAWQFLTIFLSSFAVSSSQL